MSNLTPEIEGFTIIKRLGVGARTTIYLATDLATKQQIALKQIVLENPEDTRIFEQIDTEYKVSQLLDHPYLRKCYKLIKRRKMLKVNEVLLTMEMFQGQSLEDGPSLSLGDVLLVFRMVATALNAMHQKGYVHCDIKPNNIMFGHDGTIKIIDFGQSCKIGAIKKRIQGTPDYIAPEQVRREHLSHRTDIFNLGATMYWALTGKNVPTLIPKKNEFGIPVVQKECKTPHEIYSKIPMSVSELVMECVREKQVERPENMAAVTARLDVLIRKIFENKLVNNGK